MIQNIRLVTLLVIVVMLLISFSPVNAQEGDSEVPIAVPEEPVDAPEEPVDVSEEPTDLPEQPTDLPDESTEPPMDDEPVTETPEEVTCAEDESIIQVLITPDDYPEETAWEITNLETNELVASGASESANVCVPPGLYLWNITDEYSDGICCEFGEGSYEILVDNEPWFASDGAFTSAEKITIPVRLEEYEAFNLNCAEGELALQLILLPDGMPEEVSWSLARMGDTEDSLEVVLEDQTESLGLCLACDESTTWMVSVVDTNEDGICCDNGVGFYDIYIDNMLLLHSTGDFGAEETTAIPCSM